MIFDSEGIVVLIKGDIIDGKKRASFFSSFELNQIIILVNFYFYVALFKQGVDPMTYLRFFVAIAINIEAGMLFKLFLLGDTYTYGVLLFARNREIRCLKLFLNHVDLLKVLVCQRVYLEDCSCFYLT